jgi:hypothetical protein
MKTFFVFLILCVFSASPYMSRDTITLFNGRDLTGWETHVPQARLNIDSRRVFSVVKMDGRPAIKVSGEHFGGMSTIEEYSNYHLSVEFKWGEARYIPKLGQKRDSGLLYHGVGEQGGGDDFWLQSQEFQVQEGDCGDYWGVAGNGFDVPVVGEGETFSYDPKGQMKAFSEKSPNGRHVSKILNAEKPKGKWNKLELYCFGDSAIHVVNGKVVMRLYHSRLPDGTPLRRGKIQLQSEGAEVYYRKIELRPIDKMPDLGH